MKNLPINRWLAIAGCAAAFSAASAVYAAPEIIAHRGASFAAPENTVASANLAWKVGADGVEIDIYITKDHHIVVCHDPTTTRTTGVNMKVAQSYLSDLRALDAGKWKGPQWTGEKIPTFEEILKTLPKGKRLFVEIKCGPEILPDFFRILDVSGVDSSQIVVISFYADVIRDVERKRPNLKTYWLCGASTKPGATEKQIRKVRSIKADGVDVAASAAVNAEYVRKMREAGFGLYAWTIDDDTTAKRITDLGFDGITTNKPAEIRVLLEEKR